MLISRLALFVACAIAVSALARAQETTTTTPNRKSVPMPLQKQSLDYFAGEWTFKRIGAESPIAPGPGTGSVRFVPASEGKLRGQTEATLDDGGKYRETAVVGFNEQSKSLQWSEERPNGVKIAGVGDWTSPIAIRFALDPIKLKGQTYQLKRTIAIISANSFTLTEEVSIDGGPFVRLGNAVYTKKVKREDAKRYEGHEGEQGRLE